MPGEVLPAKISKDRAIRRRATACVHGRARCLAVLLLTVMIGCAMPDKHPETRLSANVLDTPLAPREPQRAQPAESQAKLQRLPATSNDESPGDRFADAYRWIPPPVQLASFQDPESPAPGNTAPGNTTPGNTTPGNTAPGNTTPGNTAASPDQALRPVQPAGANPPAATESPSDALAEPPVPLAEPSVPRAGPGPSTSGQAMGHAADQGSGFPIDLPTALRLAGANNLHIALAAERVAQAAAAAQASRAKWLPSLNAGISYNKHDGRIQATDGEVIEANRGSLFVGGGVGLGRAPLNGGAGGPPRLFVDMSVADLLFEPLAARQMVDAAAADQSAVFNEKVLQAALAYQRLVHSHALTAIRQEAVAHATRLADITASFAQAGEGYPADAQRARAELARRQGELLEATETVDDASTALALVLRLDPATRLVPTDQEVVPLDLFVQSQPLESLIAQAIAARPDLESAQMLVSASATKADLEHWRPWLPHLYAGYSGGGFGGNGNSDVKAFSDRSDFDIAAVWQLENFGLGNAARRRNTESQHRQAHLEVDRLRDAIAAEVTTAFHRKNSRRRQIDVALPQITAASNSLELNFTGIRGGVLRPIEPQQAIGALVDARARYLNALTRYNAAQFQLLHAIGLPPYLSEDQLPAANIPENDGVPASEAVPPPPVVF